MILAAVYWLLYGIVAGICSPLLLFSDVALPTGLSDSIAHASTALAVVQTVVPTTTLIAVVAYWIVLESAIHVYYWIRWTYQKVPGIN